MFESYKREIRKVIDAINCTTKAVNNISISGGGGGGSALQNINKNQSTTAYAQFNSGGINYYGRERIVFDNISGVELERVFEWSADGRSWNNTKIEEEVFIDWVETVVPTVPIVAPELPKMYNKPYQVIVVDSEFFPANTVHSITIKGLARFDLIINGVSLRYDNETIHFEATELIEYDIEVRAGGDAFIYGMK